VLGSTGYSSVVQKHRGLGIAAQAGPLIPTAKPIKLRYNPRP
jgi:hypothetical protein